MLNGHVEECTIVRAVMYDASLELANFYICGTKGQGYSRKKSESLKKR